MVPYLMSAEPARHSTSAELTLQPTRVLSQPGEGVLAGAGTISPTLAATNGTCAAPDLPSKCEMLVPISGSRTAAVLATVMTVGVEAPSPGAGATPAAFETLRTQVEHSDHQAVAAFWRARRDVGPLIDEGTPGSDSLVVAFLS